MKLDKMFLQVLLLVFLIVVGPDCLMYSLNNKGPCINGGKLSCRGDKVDPNMICECPPHYKGMFCEDKMENVIEIISALLFPWLLVLIIDANKMVLYIIIYHHILLITKTCISRLQDSVI